jgi:hypothetical protein
LKASDPIVRSAYHVYDAYHRKLCNTGVKMNKQNHEALMPPKLDPETETRRLNLVAPASWVRKIDDWRRHQPDLPNISEAIRRLVEIGLKAKGK